MKRMLAAVLFLGALGASARATVRERAAVSATERQRKDQLRERLCAAPELSCAYVTAVFADSRLTIYGLGSEHHNHHPPRGEEPNPYLTRRFGLLTTDSLQRCRRFVEAHAAPFARAYLAYGVPPEIICGILRIETNYGIPTKLSPNPLGRRPAINQLVTLYVRSYPRERPDRLVRRQRFAFQQMKALLREGPAFGWDLFKIPGSPTGAIGLVQFEPSSLRMAVDGDGDGKIDLFDPADAILSAANYLATQGWDRTPDHQRHAVRSYYGGDSRNRQTRYYLTAVLQYANEASRYLHATESSTALSKIP